MAADGVSDILLVFTVVDRLPHVVLCDNYGSSEALRGVQTYSRPGEVPESGVIAPSELLEMMDDEELRADMLEAETSLPALASKIVIYPSLLGAGLLWIFVPSYGAVGLAAVMLICRILLGTGSMLAYRRHRGDSLEREASEDCPVSCSR